MGILMTIWDFLMRTLAGLSRRNISYADFKFYDNLQINRKIMCIVSSSTGTAHARIFWIYI